MKGQRTRRRSHQNTPQEVPLIEAMSTEIEELREANKSLAAEVEAQGQVIDAIVPVTLKEWDWDAQNFIEREYPYHIIKKFVDDLRNKKQWIEDTTSQEVWRRFQRFQENLTDAKNEAAALESAA